MTKRGETRSKIKADKRECCEEEDCVGRSPMN